MFELVNIREIISRQKHYGVTMNINAGLLINPSQLKVFTYEVESKDLSNIIIDLETMNDQNLNYIVYDQDEENIDGFLGHLEKTASSFPSITLNEAGLNKDMFEKFQPSDFFDFSNNILNAWKVNNNLLTIEELFPLRDHLLGLWKGDRNTFFEELWYMIKRNLATTELNIIFNDLIEGDTEKNEKNKLQVSYLQGDKTPNFGVAQEAQITLFDNLKENINANFEISEYDNEKGRLVILAKIDSSPIVIMANCTDCSGLQLSILSSLFTGLQGK
jgi:hypothetical protein